MHRRPTFSHVSQWTTLAACIVLMTLAFGSPAAAGPVEDEAAKSTDASAVVSVDAVVCASEAKPCAVGEGDTLCWPADEACPRALSEVAEEHAAYETVIRGPLAGPSTLGAATRGTQEITVRVSGCGNCFLSERSILPGNVQGVVLLESYSQGSVNYTGGHWAKSAFWEKSCFGHPAQPQKCGTVQRTYLVYY